MAKDPATLWYWNDWHSGTVTFSRHLKGCYMDLLHAQFNNGRLSLDAIKTVLGTDFSSWNALQKKFRVDEQGLYYNERAELEQLKRAKFSESRRKNGLGKKSEHMLHHVEDEDENSNSHSVFSLRLLSNEGELDKEAIEVSTKVTVTMQLLSEFNANLKNSNVHHRHFSEYKKHLVNWIPKKPKERNNVNGTSKVQSILKVNEEVNRYFDGTND